MRPCLVVHCHEVSLKGGNRPLFLRILRENLARTLADRGPVTVEQLPGRIVISPGGDADVTALAERLTRVPGVANVAAGWRSGAAMDALQRAVERVIEGRAFGSFRISARRAFKTFPLTSIELNRALGAHVQMLRPGARVDLERAEVDVHVEVLPAEAFVYCDRRAGAGGLPVGVSGTVAALLSGGIDSPVAAWRLIRRGCRAVFVHFHSVPYLPDTSIGKARDLVRRLTEWQYASTLHLVPFGEIQREVVLAVPPPARVIVYRRLMVRIAERIGRLAGAQALVTGDSLGQVASQTLQNLARVSEAATLPMLRPLVGMDKLEITAEARALGTFEISIEPDADCCTLFVPKHPGTALRQEDVEGAERRLDVARLVEMGVQGAREEHFEFPPGAGPFPPRAARRALRQQPARE